MTAADQLPTRPRHRSDQRRLYPCRLYPFPSVAFIAHIYIFDTDMHVATTLLVLVATPSSAETCGNGIFSTAESCDDNNTLSGVSDRVRSSGRSKRRLLHAAPAWTGRS